MGRSAIRGRQIQSRKLPARDLSREGDLFAVRRPPRLGVFKGMIRDLAERTALGRDQPYIFVEAAIVLVTCPVGDECDSGAVGRPLGIGIVPVFAGCDLLVFPTGRIEDPKMAALVVIP